MSSDDVISCKDAPRPLATILQKDDETRPDYKQDFEMRVYLVNDNSYYSLMTGFFVFSFPDVALRD